MSTNKAARPTQRRVRVAIIGAGSAGLSARREVAKVTDDYVVIDDGPLGTTCARVGCMPSKVLIQVANDFHRRGAFAEEGIAGAESLSLDSVAVMHHVRKLRDRFVRGVMGSMEQWRETSLLRGRAVFSGASRLTVTTSDGDVVVDAERVIIATGSSPVLPQPWRGVQHLLFDSDGVFELAELPKSAAVIGLGVIGLELGQALSRLGVEVRGFSRSKRLGGLTDPGLQDEALTVIRDEFAVTLGGVDGLVERDGQLVVIADGEEHVVERGLFAAGRRPNVAGLQLQNAGIPVTARGLPTFDSGTFRLGDAPVYFVGDVNASRPILHEASDQGRIAGFNAVRDADQCFRKRTLLGITFSDPNIAVVGASYADVVASGVPFVVGKVSYRGQGRAIVKLKEKGALHVYVADDDGRLLGAEMIAPDGEHLAHLLSWAMATKLTVFDTLSLPFYHPVVEEGVRTALRDAARQVRRSRPDLEVLRCQDPPAGG